MRTSELTGAMLDYWVAKAERVDAVMSDPYRDGSRSMVTFYGRGHDGRMDGRSYKPSEHWEDGGPLIAKYRIGFGIYEPGERAYFACTGISDSHGAGHGPDHLIAACRAVVQAAFGNEVQEGSAS